MPSRRRQLWIPLNVGWIAFAAGYLLASGGFSPTPKPVGMLPPAETPMPTLAPVATSTPVPFQWSQLESTDYATYIANLRAIGCPEQTLHDIIAGDLANVYAQKRQSLQSAQAQAPAEVQAQSRQTLDNEERRLLNTLLEPSPPNTPSIATASTPAASASTFSLSPAEGQTSVSVVNAGQNGNAPAAGASAISPASAASSAAPATTEQAASSATDAPTTGSNSSSSNTTAATNRINRWKSMFSPEEEDYRTKWGWQAFDTAQRAANSEGN